MHDTPLKFYTLVLQQIGRKLMACKVYRLNFVLQILQTLLCSTEENPVSKLKGDAMSADFAGIVHQICSNT